MTLRTTAILLIFGVLASCASRDTPAPENFSSPYFPPLTGDDWETSTPEELGWQAQNIPDLLTFLEETNTRAFLLLHNGRIVMEEYFGTDLNQKTFTGTSIWYWASAGKTLTAFTVGLAQEQGYLKISDRTSDYLGAGWSSLSAEQESEIRIVHQLTMTTGLNDEVPNADCTDPDCLQYLASPGTRWAYHNAPYTLLDGVVTSAAGDFDGFFKNNLAQRIGMNGFWSYVGYNHIYFSSPRSMARFGILMAHDGIWNGEAIMVNQDYLREMITPSQDINKSYGYLWWLNGQESFKLPGLQVVWPGSITPNAPRDMFAAMGKNGQLLNICPKEKLIVVRMGDNPDNSLVSAVFQNDLWEKINLVISE